tara:strand:- start:285 stop:716 length:432 start_codon:yes stop_codon:yes gene_type:complete
MNLYKNILVAVDLSQDSAAILDKARGISKAYGAQLNLVHVIEPIAIGYAIEVSSIDVEGLHQEATEQAKQSLIEMGNNIHIPEARMHILLGQPAREIKELANEIMADLIIMGNHSRHGWELLFSSTSTGVAHGVNCDLLTVHI